LYELGLNRGIGESDVRRSRFQFKIRHLIVVVAVCAVCFALLRTPGGVLILYTGVILPGFMIERSRGGPGILGGALSASTITASLVVVVTLLAVMWRPPSAAGISALVVATFAASVVTFFVGFLLSCGLCVLLEMTKHLFQPEHQDRSSYFDEILWLEPDKGSSEG
jgi:hypothetical protein